MRERAYTVAEISGITLLAWLYLIRMPMSAADFGGGIGHLLEPLPSPIVA